jgi:hypothetical protein
MLTVWCANGTICVARLGLSRLPVSVVVTPSRVCRKDLRMRYTRQRNRASVDRRVSASTIFYLLKPL